MFLHSGYFILQPPFVILKGVTRHSLGVLSTEIAPASLTSSLMTVQTKHKTH